MEMRIKALPAPSYPRIFFFQTRVLRQELGLFESVESSAAGALIFLKPLSAVARGVFVMMISCLLK